MNKFRELPENAYNKIKALQLKKAHPIEGGMKEDREIDKEINKIYKEETESYE